MFTRLHPIYSTTHSATQTEKRPDKDGSVRYRRRPPFRSMLLLRCLNSYFTIITSWYPPQAISQWLIHDSYIKYGARSCPGLYTSSIQLYIDIPGLDTYRSWLSGQDTDPSMHGTNRKYWHVTNHLWYLWPGHVLIRRKVTINVSLRYASYNTVYVYYTGSEGLWGHNAGQSSCEGSGQHYVTTYQCFT